MRRALRGRPLRRTLQGPWARRATRLYPRRQRRHAGAGRQRGRLRRHRARRRRAGLRQCWSGHPPFCRHRAPAAVCGRHRAQYREPDSIDQGSGGTDGLHLRARECRPCAHALSAQAGRRRRPEGQVRDHGRQFAGSAAPGPDRRRRRAGAGADAVAARGRARAGERHGPRRRQAPPRRIVRIHGGGGTHQGDRTAPAGNGRAGRGIGGCAQGAARDDRRSVERGSPQGDDHRARPQGARRDHRASPRLALPRDGEHRSRRGQARRAKPDRRRPHQAGRAHLRAARHLHRRGLNLRVRDLTISYGGEPVLEGASLAVGDGSFVSLVGPSGSGKSSLLRAVIGLQQPLAGTVETGLARAQVGILFQDDALLPWKTARDNVALGLIFNGMERRKALAEADAWLERLDLAGFGDRFPRHLSGGQRKRVALAQVLAMKPRLLLMDEPFASLDAIVRARVVKDLVALVERENISVLLVTHDLEEALTLSDGVYLLSQGPRARITEYYPVPIPRPRDPVLSRTHPAFAPLYERLWADLSRAVDQRAEAA